MSGDAEPAKQLLPYLQRADELQKHEPLVAYYCRLFAMEKGLKIPPKERTKTTNSILVSLMNQLEKDKKSVKLSPDDNLYLEGFASNVFAKADKQDRAGRADLNTAKTFYAASIFFEILHQFGELQPDIEQKQKYALWKAADIRKALKEGRKPQPGPPGGEDDLSIFSDTNTAPTDIAPSENLPASHTPRSESFSALHRGLETSPHLPENTFPPSHARAPSSPPFYPGSDFPSNDLQHSLPPSTRHDDSAYQPSYHHLSQPSEQHLPDQHLSSTFHPGDALPRAYSHEMQPPPNYPHEPSPPNYPREGLPPQYSYPNFQTYPSFSDSSLPATSGQYSPYYQGHDTTYVQQQQQPPTNYGAPPPYGTDSMNGSHARRTPQSTGSGEGSQTVHTPSPSMPTIPSYAYDSNYQPSVEKIAEAHKAARFAVGALAFDDVPVAVEFLRKSLELLTNPNAESH